MALQLFVGTVAFAVEALPVVSCTSGEWTLLQQERRLVDCRCRVSLRFLGLLVIDTLGDEVRLRGEHCERQDDEMAPVGTSRIEVFLQANHTE